MASRFELILVGENAVWLRAAGEEALGEIERLDAQLSIFRESSEVSRINARAAASPVQVEPRLFALLRDAYRLYEETGGAFDITVAPLMRAWGFFRAAGRMPSPDQVATARAVTGMHLVHLDENERTIRFERPGVMIDLGGIGKGYAVDEALGLLREAGVEHAFLHGGTSTSAALGTDEVGSPWQVAIPYPEAAEQVGFSEGDPLAVVSIVDRSLSVSAVWGKAFVFEGQTFGHVLDPRLGRPVDGAILTAVTSESATEADALSTALLVEGRRCGELVSAMADRGRALLLFPSSEMGRYEVIEAGLSSLPSNRRLLTRAE